MAAKLPIALACLLFAFIITTSFPYVVHARKLAVPVPVPPTKLRTGVPYYMIPLNLFIIGIAPLPALRCPYAVGEASSSNMVPVTFSTVSGRNGTIDPGEEVYITFLITLPQNISSTWGYSSLADPSAERLPICLGCNLDGIVAAKFNIQKNGAVHSNKVDESGENVGIFNIISYFDAWSRGFLLALSTGGTSARFTFFQADAYYHQGIKSVA